MNAGAIGCDPSEHRGFLAVFLPVLQGSDIDRSLADILGGQGDGERKAAEALSHRSGQAAHYARRAATCRCRDDGGGALQRDTATEADPVG